MRRSAPSSASRLFAPLLLAALAWPSGVLASAPDELAAELGAFEARTGARLVFRRADLPPGNYHDIMTSLSPERRLAAARILVREAEKYPRGYLRAIGFRAFGVFAACASREGDGYRPYLAELGGYRYFGIWNGRDAAAGAYYTDGQLPLTFHHEVFHHVDATMAGRTRYRPFFTSDDPRFQAAITGAKRYPAPTIPPALLARLRARTSGRLLRSAVGAYASKAPGEDQAETARHVMAWLPDALVQACERPNLPGSQRILHVLQAYEAAAPNGPGIEWWVEVALAR